jgi:hypothetical protein
MSLSGGGNMTDREITQIDTDEMRYFIGSKDFVHQNR